MAPGPRPALGPVKRQAPVFAELLETSQGHMQPAPAAEDPAPGPEPAVEVAIGESADPFYSEYDPTHPDADAQGLVLKPNVDPVQEMMTLIKATRAYEANATALDAAKQMLNRALDI
jgi:flagellar basal-body rod protein FlgC